MAMSKRLAAEALGTFWLVLGGCGSAVLAAAFPDVGIGLVGVSLAFGLTRRRGTLQVVGVAALCRGAGDGCDCRGRRPVFHCQRETRIRSCRWPGVEWLRRPFAG